MTVNVDDNLTHDAIHLKDPSLINPTKPGELRVIKRNGTLSSYDAERIATAMKKAFLAVEGENDIDNKRIHETAEQIANRITEVLNNRWPTGGTIHIEQIQDLVELGLMRLGEHKVARAYVLYREQRKQERIKAEQAAAADDSIESRVRITMPDGSKQPLNMNWLTGLVENACADLPGVDPQPILTDIEQNLFDGVALKDVYKALVMVARTYVETEPDYTYATARLLLQDLYKEALDFLGVDYQPTDYNIAKLYPKCLKYFIQQGIELELVNPELANFDLEKLSKAIKSERDLQFQYLGLQTLYDRYFIHQRDTRFEMPQIFFMRVAMGLAKAEPKNRDDWAIRFYDLLSSFDYMSSTPTLFNSGTLREQLSSCFLTTVPDDLSGIYGAIRDNALLSKFAGGLGNDWTQVRGMGAHIKGTNGKSLGVVPFLNVADATAVAVNQGGKRKGAVCAYLEAWHMDIEEFLELRKNTGDDRRRTHDMNTANWIPDLFMKRVFEGGEWTLFSPDEVPDLHDLYGAEFEQAYERYEERARQGEIRGKTLKAVSLWRKMLGMLFETGHPWVTFKDPCNVRSPQQHCGVVHSSNLCTEITLNTSAEEVAVCNLGSINLPNHIKDGKLDVEKLKKTTKIAMRMLDNVIDINYYSIPQAKNSNFKHRPVGLGVMGFQDVLYKLGIPYASDEAVTFADNCMEEISYHAIWASTELAEERGTYETFDGSLWSRGILPIDSITNLKEVRGKYLEQDTSFRLDWDALRQRVTRIGVRNSNHMAIAPTATIANICGVSQSIEPTYQNLFVKSNLSGEFTVVNAYLAHDLKRLGLWDNVMIHDLKYYNGSVQAIERIPAELKALYATAFEVEPKWLIDCASRRQKWIDQAQSLNLYMAEPSGKKLDILYRMAWLRGLKTTYYLRSLGATSTEKATIADGALNAVNNGAPKACSIDDPDCEACQ